MRTVKEHRRRSARSPFETYLTEIDDSALLKPDEERELAYRVAEGDPEARDHMVRSNLRLVVTIARQYAGKGLPLEDLIAEGNIGLLRAVEGFDPDVGTRFATYATYWVRQSIRSALNRSGRVVRLPHYVNGLLSDWLKTTAALHDELGRPPTREEVAGRLGLPRRKVRVIEKALKVHHSGHLADRPDGAPAVAEVLADNREPAPDDHLAGAEQLRLALTSLDRLSEREVAVLRMRYGLDGDEPRTLQEIGDHLGYTRERVRQIERDALAALRQGFTTM